MFTGGLDLNSDNCIPVAGFVQTKIHNKWAGLSVLSLDKHPTKIGQSLVLSTTGWQVYWARAHHAWGSAEHMHYNCNAGATIAAAQNNLGLKLPPSASKGKTVDKLEQADLNPKFCPNFFQTNLYFTFFFFTPQSLLPC